MARSTNKSDIPSRDPLRYGRTDFRKSGDFRGFKRKLFAAPAKKLWLRVALGFPTGLLFIVVTKCTIIIIYIIIIKFT